MSYSTIAKGAGDLLAGIVIMGLLIACTTTPALALACVASQK